MKNSPRRSTALGVLLVLLSTAASEATLAQRAAGGSKLVVTVTVPPICTVAVTPGQLSPTDAIAVRCRNLPDSHPQPVVTEAEAEPVSESTVAADGNEEVADEAGTVANPIDAAAAISPQAMVVINF